MVKLDIMLGFEPRVLGVQIPPSLPVCERDEGWEIVVDVTVADRCILNRVSGSIPHVSIDQMQ